MTPMAADQGALLRRMLRALPRQERLFVWGEWLLVLGLAATLAGTTLCLGGYLAETMQMTAWAVFGLAMLAGVLWLIRPSSSPLPLNWAVLLPLPFLIYALASVLWLAPAQWLAWREWLLWLQMWVVFGLGLHFGRGRPHTWVLVGTFILLGLVGVMLAAYQRYVDSRWLMLGWVHGWTQAQYFLGRSAGMFGIPNSLAGLLELLAPLCWVLALMRSNQLKVRLFCGWLGTLLVFALVLSGSRGGWISLALTFLLWALLAGRNWQRRLVGVIFILLVTGAGLGVLDRFSIRAHERIQPFLEGKFEITRPIIWKVAGQIWSDHPWLGGGAAAYNVLFDRYRPLGFKDEPIWAHNDYLNTLSDYGMVGFAWWLLAAVGLLALGWRAVQKARRGEVSAGAFFSHWPARLGLFLGLTAFALHLAVDFHTKIPALALAAALVLALLLRDEIWLLWPMRPVWARGLGLALAVGAFWIAAQLAAPLYQAEARRYSARRLIDQYAATGRGDLRSLTLSALDNFSAAVKVDPTNGQAWADLSYATVQTWRLNAGDLVVLGQRAEQQADRALALAPLMAEFWVRKGVALDMQARPADGELCFKQALKLAPHTRDWWYYYAYHLSRLPERKAEALRAVETGLSLDPSFSTAVLLRQQLVAPR